MLPESFYTSSAIIERPVKLADGVEHTLYFKELPAIEFRRYQLAESSEDDEVRAASLSKLIAASLCEPDGKPAITLKQALQLKPAAMREIVAVITEINGYGDAAKNA